MAKIIENFYTDISSRLLVDDFIRKLNNGYHDAALRSVQFKDERMRKQVLSNYQKDAADLAFQQVFHEYAEHGSKWNPKNNKNNSYRYSYGVAGKIRFSVNRLAHSNGQVRWANFRANHALTNQFSLFSDSQVDRPDFPYCLILHGPTEKHEERLGFVRIVLPDPNLKMYIEELELSIGMINTIPVPMETELPDAEPKAKPVKKQNVG